MYNVCLKVYFLLFSNTHNTMLFYFLINIRLGIVKNITMLVKNEQEHVNSEFENICAKLKKFE